MPIGDIQPPSKGIQEEPTVSICINTEWVSQLIGIVYPAQYPEWWAGTIEENRFARKQIRELLYILSVAEGCDVANKCCIPQTVINRFNPTTGRPEVSYDGGVTWEPSPDDPKNAVILYPPPVSSGGNTKCDAANAGAQHIKDLIAATGTNLETAATIFALVVGIAEAILALVLVLVTAGTITPIVTAVATAIWGAGTSLFALGIEAYNDYWTSDKQDAILCTLYCNIGSNGQFNEAQYQAWRADIKSTLPASPAFDIVMTSINALGAQGLSQMCSYGLQEGGDCSECECSGHWCLEYDFRTSDYGISFLYGTYSAGVGIVGTPAGSGKSIVGNVDWNVNTTVTYATIEVAFAVEGNVNFAGNDGAIALVSEENVTSGEYTAHNVPYDQSDSTVIVLNPSSGAVQGADVTMIRVYMEGNGVVPPGAELCEGIGE